MRVAADMKKVMHPETQKLLETLLVMLAEQGEEATYLYIRENVLKKWYALNWIARSYRLF